VSTSIRDVVRPYGTLGLARIADEPQAFVQACTAAMAEDPVKRITQADVFLRQTSWDGTWTRIRAQLDAVLRTDEGPAAAEDATAV
jgi:UDP-galactopyranose mutase